LASILAVIESRHGDSVGNDHGSAARAAFSWAITARPSPTRPTSAGTFVDSCSGEMSSWTTRTSGEKRGGSPKCMIQFRRAPSTSTRSAWLSACERAAPTDSGWSSGITPLPIGEFRNGRPVVSTNARTSASARDHAMPLPTITNGRSAVLRAASAAAMSSSAAWLRGGGAIVAAVRTASSSTRPRITSSGRSRYAAPGRPYQAVRTACST
jgi:hypothetical protein